MTETERTSNPPPVLLAAAEDLCRQAAQELYTAIQDIRQGRLEDVKAAMAAIRDLRAAFQLAMEERNRFEKLRKQDEGAAYSYALDLGKARDEIARRLDRIRDAGGD